MSDNPELGPSLSSVTNPSSVGQQPTRRGVVDDFLRHEEAQGEHERALSLATVQFRVHAATRNQIERYVSREGPVVHSPIRLIED